MGNCREALQQSSKRGPRGCSPIQACDLLNECNERPRVDSCLTSIRQFGRRTDRRRLVPTPRSNQPCECGGEVRRGPKGGAPPKKKKKKRGAQKPSPFCLQAAEVIRVV